MDCSIGRYFSYPDRMSFGKTGPGAWVVTSKREILNEKYLDIDDIGNGKALIRNNRLDRTKCKNMFYDRMITERTHSYTTMLGAICGDVAGSIYEYQNIKYIPDKEKIISQYAEFTDDSVMTLAVAVGIKNAVRRLHKRNGFSVDDEGIFLEELTKSVREWGNKYPNAGYGGAFRTWLADASAGPYGSWGNGSAMRASYAGWIASSLEDSEFLAAASAKITHNHPNGIKGAVAIAGSIFLLRNMSEASENERKKAVDSYVGKLYNMNFSIEKIRPEYSFDVSCEGSVPVAIKAFLEGNDFSEVLALAISVGGDSDTIAAMAGSLAEVIYPIPEGIRNRVLERLDYGFKSELAGAIDALVE